MYILWSQVKFSVSPYSESIVFEYVSIYFSNDNCLSDSHLLLNIHVYDRIIVNTVQCYYIT